MYGVCMYVERTYTCMYGARTYILRVHTHVCTGRVHTPVARTYTCMYVERSVHTPVCTWSVHIHLYVRGACIHLICTGRVHTPVCAGRVHLYVQGAAYIHLYVRGAYIGLEPCADYILSAALELFHFNVRGSRCRTKIEMTLLHKLPFFDYVFQSVCFFSPAKSRMTLNRDRGGVNFQTFAI
jgi:hypothetical protein